MTSPPDLARVASVLEGLGTAEAVPGPRIRFTTTAGNLREAVRRALAGLDLDHFIQIGSVDTGKAIELHYHFTGPHRAVVTVAVALPREGTRAPSLADLLPPAGLLERQVHDLMGVEFDGHPALDRFILNEDWPAGEHPLRKDWKPREGAFYGGVRDAAPGPGGG